MPVRIALDRTINRHFSQQAGRVISSFFFTVNTCQKVLIDATDGFYRYPFEVVGPETQSFLTFSQFISMQEIF